MTVGIRCGFSPSNGTTRSTPRTAASRCCSAPNPIPLGQIHPVDAESRRIADGDPIRIHNELGTIRCTASVTDKVPVGTVAVPFGRWGSDPDSGGANSLTSDRLGDLANGPTFCDNLVEVDLDAADLVEAVSG